ncbi:MAG: baseplate J/gp47 family protein [Bacteroidales bacterium]|nr:baseplate J/gp47 family protein [Clostridium sp.]MCM1203312.1 baseplate J/gp47 family protein [Bacteroidales bacterium]
MPDFYRDTSEKTIEKIERMAAAYTGNWSFNPEYPDMGTALATLFADMMDDTVRRFNALPERYRIEFYNLLGAQCLPGKEAEGYVVFPNVNEEVPGVPVGSGTRVLGSGGEEKTVFFETQEDIYVSSARLEKVYFVDGQADYISPPLEFPIMETAVNNQQSHVFYLGHGTVFSIKTEGEIILDFPVLRYCGREELNRFLMNEAVWSYYSEEGFVHFSDFRYEEGRVYLYKNRQMPPSAKTDIQGTESFWIRMETGAMKPESKVVFPGISLASAGSYLLPEMIYDGIMELDKESFLPFGEKPYPYAEVYIACDEAFSKKGAALRMDFDLEFLSFPGELKSPEYPVQWRNIMPQSAFQKPEPVDILIHSVVWEYYNGLGWTRIPDTKGEEALFRVKREKEHITVSFLCPEDICPFLMAAKESYCIRLRISKIVNLYAMDGIYITPCIKNLRLDYRYEKTNILPERAFAVNGMVTEEIKCAGEFTPFFQRFPDRKMLYLSFSGPLNEEGICLLFVPEKMKKQAGIRYRYEYYGKAGWSGLKAEDTTADFTKTGTVTLYTAHTFLRQEFFGQTGFWIRIVQEKDVQTEAEAALPVLTGIYINAAAVTAQRGSGKYGVLPSGGIYGMERSIGFISKVTNPEPITGGWDGENRGQAVKRFSAFLRHQDRAVTPGDFEDLVYGRVRNIVQVKCFPGRDECGKRMPGHITLAVLPDTESGLSAEQIEEEILESLLPHIERGIYDEGRLHIVEPEWIAVNVHMSVVVKKTAKLYLLKEKISREINAFVHPVTGNFDKKGWKIGVLPSVPQLQNVCSQMDEILYIKNLSLKDKTDSRLYALGIGGEHEIEIIPE